MNYALMLAQPSQENPDLTIRRLQRSGDWTFEFKYDGIRALVFINGGEVKIVNRNGRDITYRYPDVVEHLQGAQLTGVLDGEIVCLDARGCPDFPRIHRRDAQASPQAALALARTMPAQFVAFDVLDYKGVDLRLRPYRDRRKYLEDLAPELGQSAVVPPVSDDGEAMWAAVQELCMEGLVAKRKDSRYIGRRSGAWVKIKSVHRLSALVSGFDRGEGSRSATFGALHLSLLDEGGGLVAIGSVGTGFTDADCRTIWQRLQAGETLIVDVDYLEVSPTGQLRMPSFKGVRTDLEILECTTGQLNGRPTE